MNFLNTTNDFTSQTLTLDFNHFQNRVDFKSIK